MLFSCIFFLSKHVRHGFQKTYDYMHEHTTAYKICILREEIQENSIFASYEPLLSLLSKSPLSEVFDHSRKKPQSKNLDDKDLTRLVSQEILRVGIYNSHAKIAVLIIKVN